MGDSGYSIFRLNDKRFACLYRTKPMMHCMNCPYQIGVGGYKLEQADRRDHLLKRNDVIILGTDGFWDNIEPEDIQKALNIFVSETLKINACECSNLLLNLADKNSISDGKEDDITVVVIQLIKCKS